MVKLAVRKGSYTISSDKALLDRTFIQKWLNEQSYWAQDRTAETVGTSIDHSLCFGLYEGAHQIGFARVVTDYATFAWLCDVFVEETYRGQGLGKWLVETITQEATLKDLRIFILATKDAHGLYERHGGFHALENPDRWMARPIPARR